MCYSTGLAYCLSRGLSLLRFFTEDAGAAPPYYTGDTRVFFLNLLEQFLVKERKFDRLRKVSPIYLFGKKALLELGWLK